MYVVCKESNQKKIEKNWLLPLQFEKSITIKKGSKETKINQHCS